MLSGNNPSLLLRNLEMAGPSAEFCEIPAGIRTGSPTMKDLPTVELTAH